MKEKDVGWIGVSEQTLGWIKDEWMSEWMIKHHDIYIIQAHSTNQTWHL